MLGSIIACPFDPSKMNCLFVVEFCLCSNDRINHSKIFSLKLVKFVFFSLLAEDFQGIIEIHGCNLVADQNLMTSTL